MLRTLDGINRASTDPEAFIKNCTDEYLRDIDSVARKIVDNKDIKIVAIAGPSASGKTTTAHILMNRLSKQYESIAVVSLDDFYKRVEDRPVLSDGSLDMESVDSLDLPLIKKHFSEIINSGETCLPRFDFKTKTRIENDRYIKVGENGIVIVEGLHALNPRIYELLPQECIYKIYICLDRSIEDNNGKQFLTSRQIRLIRRVIRDIQFRNTDIKETLRLWNSVFEGEIKYLFPYKDTADSKIRTMHSFEVCVYKENFCALRSGVDRNTPWYEYFTDTVNSLERVNKIDPKFVPSDSLIREFIG